MIRLRSVVRNKQHEQMVQQLKTPDEGKGVFGTFRELMCFAAVLGYQMGRRTSIPDNSRGPDIMIEEFNRNDSVDLIYLMAVAESKSADILKSDSEIDMVTIFEEYANGGLEIIKSWMTQYNDPIGFQAILQGLKSNGFIDDETAKIEDIMETFKF